MNEMLMNEKVNDMDAACQALADSRDHRKLGKELELFDLMEEGPGLPFYLPKGLILKNQLIDIYKVTCSFF